MFLKNNNIISYIGSKRNLYEFIDKNMLSKYKNKNFIFYDLFAGTASMSLYTNYYYKNSLVIGNDISPFSEILFNIINITCQNINMTKIINYLKEIDSIYEKEKNETHYPLYIFNEFSEKGMPETFNKNRFYFYNEIAKKIDFIKYRYKKDIKNFNKNEQIILMIMLLNFADRNANTTGLYGSFLKLLKIKYKNNLLEDKKYHIYNKKLLENISEYINNNNNKYTQKHSFFNKHIEETLKMIEFNNKSTNIFYLDPPYNTRDYQTNYHILNYIIDLDFVPKKYIKNGSKTAVPIQEKRIKNPFTSKIKTPNTLKNIINIIKTKDKNAKIYFSYSNKGLISIEKWEKEILNSYKYNIYKQEYKAYKSKKEHKDNSVIEYLIEIL